MTLYPSVSFEISFCIVFYLFSVYRILKIRNATHNTVLCRKYHSVIMWFSQNFLYFYKNAFQILLLESFMNKIWRVQKKWPNSQNVCILQILCITHIVGYILVCKVYSQLLSFCSSKFWIYSIHHICREVLM